MSVSPQEVNMYMHNAMRLEQEGKYVEAEECYTKAIYGLRAGVTNPALSQEDQLKLMNYISDVAKRVQSLRAINRMHSESQRPTSAGSSATPSRPSSAAAHPNNSGLPQINVIPSSTGSPSAPRQTPNPPPARKSGASDKDTDDDADYFAVLDEVARKGKSTPSPAVSPNSANASQSKGSAARTASDGKDKGKSPLPPPSAAFLSFPGDSSSRGSQSPKRPSSAGPPAGSGRSSKSDAGNKSNTTSPSPPAPLEPLRSRGLVEHFAPRTSDLVLKAIDVATQLSQQGELKRAVDVLQHAYTVGLRQRNNPANFRNIEETLRVMRQRYYTKFPPRFLQDNPVLPEEMEVLRKSGITSTILLPIWDDVSEGYGAENVFMPCEGVWEDSFTPHLGPRQRAEGARMVRPTDLFAKPESLVIVHEADPLLIKQTVVGDCSMVCSLIICASFQKRFPSARIISNVIFPQDTSGNPIVNLKGKYCVKMLINGMTRLVTIDDRLPANPRTKQLLCTFSRDPTELWVSLMEKAFVKVCGGSYNFPGSSSSSDLYKLSGWLPDSFTFQSSSFDPEFQWQRLVHSFTTGAVLLTLSTPAEFPRGVEEKTQLSSGHAYAVIDVREVEGTRVMMLRNPWSKVTWTGDLSYRDKSESATKVHEVLEYTTELAQLGVFCMTWSDVTKYYDRCNLSWNPYMLYRTPDGGPRRPTRLACHGTFTYTTSMAQMPQLHIGVVQAPKPTRMHLVVSRHITDVAEFGLQFEKDNPTIPFIALKVFDVTGFPSLAQHLGGKCSFGMCYCRRLASASDLTTHLQPLNEVVYRNAAAHTVSFDCPAGTSNLVVVVSRTESSVQEAFNFTVTLHSELEQMKLSDLRQSKVREKASAEDTGLLNTLLENTNANAGNASSGVFMHFVPATSLKHATTVTGAWEKGKTCGGPTDSQTFVFNPQYSFMLSRPARIVVRLAVSGSSEPCQVQVVLKKPEMVVVSGSQHRSAASGGNAGGQQLTFARRVGNVNSECDLVMQAKLYGFGGAVVESALPQTLCFDTKRLLGERPVRESKKLLVTVSGGTRAAIVPAGKKKESGSTGSRGGTPQPSAGDDGSASSTFTLYDIDEGDEVSVVVLAGFQRGFLGVPATARVMVGGRVVPHTTTMEQLLMVVAHVTQDDDDELVAAATASVSARAVRVQLALASPGDGARFASDSTAGSILSDIQGVCKSITRCSSQMSSYLPQLANLSRQARTAEPPLSTTEKNFLNEWCTFLAEYVKRSASQTRAPGAVTECLPPLPAGEYTLIPSLWKKGYPGTYELTVETTEPHVLKPIPDEGDGLQERRVTGQLLREGGALRGSCRAPMVIPNSDVVFRNRKIHLTLSARGVFTCRLVLLDDDSGENKATYTNVGVFRVRDPASMELIASSGSYTSFGVALPPVELEAQVSYLVVVSASKPSTRKYLLRLYSNSGINAQFTN